ncbi:PF07103 family protein [Bacteriovorax sp. BSW11_IV]|uniref:DUF1365 domain-containing protein n=1 Tax=Bacteriovorax sp. BSW11_IV TaxID=1353529 RepID=UPI00038A2FC2|nr:DUF1365 domain-containing protein [Bacteriovorax sp. BSW11_IV]EQC48569.1 PF07103 family protein [Bacteriovorax sp. BSW11_IV]
MNSYLINVKVKHTRFSPKRYSFGTKFFWFCIDLNELDEITRKFPLIGHNDFGIYVFKDSDHLKFGSASLMNNVKTYVSQFETKEITKVELITNLRFLGYVFNPVSFFKITFADSSTSAILQVGNTFNEIKPFYVHSKCMNKNGFSITETKNYYVSPFIQMDSVLKFCFSEKNKKINISVTSSVHDEVVLSAVASGRKEELSVINLLWMTIRYPFNTLKIITLIHWHALILFLKRIKYFKKTDDKNLQIGAQIWKI